MVFLMLVNCFYLMKVKIEQDYKLNSQIDSLLFHLLYFDLVFSIYSIYGENDYINNFKCNFFEKKRDKWCYLNTLKKNLKL